MKLSEVTKFASNVGTFGTESKSADPKEFLKDLTAVE